MKGSLSGFGSAVTGFEGPIKVLLWTDTEQKQWERTREWALRSWGSVIPAPPPGQEVLSWSKETGAGSPEQEDLCAWNLRTALRAPAVLEASTVGILCRAETWRENRAIEMAQGSEVCHSREPAPSVLGPCGPDRVLRPPENSRGGGRAINVYLTHRRTFRKAAKIEFLFWGYPCTQIIANHS